MSSLIAALRRRRRRRVVVWPVSPPTPLSSRMEEQHLCSYSDAWIAAAGSIDQAPAGGTMCPARDARVDRVS